MSALGTYLFCSAVLFALMLWAVRGYVRQLMGRGDDWFLPLMAATFLLWGFMALGEADSGRFEMIGRVFSIGTTSLILISLRYFEDGIEWLRRQSTAICIGALILDLGALAFSETKPEVFLLVEASTSIVAAFLLCINVMVSFWNRKLPWMVFIPLVTMVALGLTQVDLLAVEEVVKGSGIYHFPSLKGFHDGMKDVNAAARMLSRPLLLINVLLLTFTWLGKAFEDLRTKAQTSSQNAPIQSPIPLNGSVTPSNGKRKLAFTKVWAKGIVVELTLPQLGEQPKEVRLTHAVGKVLYVLSRDRLAGQPTVTGAGSREFNNWSEEFKRLLRALAEEGIKMEADDLIDSAGTAKKALKFKAEEIEIADEVRNAFDHKTSNA